MFTVLMPHTAKYSYYGNNLIGQSSIGLSRGKGHIRISS